MTEGSDNFFNFYNFRTYETSEVAIKHSIQTTDKSEGVS